MRMLKKLLAAAVVTASATALAAGPALADPINGRSAHGRCVLGARPDVHEADRGAGRPAHGRLRSRSFRIAAGMGRDWCVTPRRL